MLNLVFMGRIMLHWVVRWDISGRMLSLLGWLGILLGWFEDTGVSIEWWPIVIV